MTGIDLNRAGTPLLEIVTEPDMRSAAEAVAYAKALHALVTLDRHLRRQHAGRLASAATPTSRCAGPAQPFGTRCEIKNLNCFRFMQQAIDYEVRRQIELIEDGGKVVQATAPVRPRHAARRARCAARKTRRTTATSPTPTCRRW